MSTEPPSWSFGKCPPENECQNDHHTCDDSENCTDLDVGFRCECKTGYIRDDRYRHLFCDFAHDKYVMHVT